MQQYHLIIRYSRKRIMAILYAVQILLNIGSYFCHFKPIDMDYLIRTDFPLFNFYLSSIFSIFSIYSYCFYFYFYLQNNIDHAYYRLIPNCFQVFSHIGHPVYLIIKDQFDLQWDFQNYTMTFSGSSSDNYAFNSANIANNRSCWYTTTPNLTYFQVKTTKNPSLNITKVFDTVGSSKTSLCQNISLEVNATYQLSYQILPDFSIVSCNVSFSISGSPYYIGSYQSSNISYLVDLQFTALYPYEQICFFPDNITYKSAFTTNGPSSWGPMLDNVTLYFFSRPIKTAEINFALTFDSINNQITLQSDFCFSCLSQYSLPINHFSSIQIKIENNEESNFVVAVDSQNFLKVIVNLKLQYDLQNFKSIELAIPNATYLHFACFIDGRPTNVSSQSQQSRFVKTILPGAKFVSQIVRDVFNMFNTFAFSYFIVNLISFYNITLLYYFLHLKTLPGFVRSFLLSLAYIFFKRGSVLDQAQRFGWIPNDFQLDFSALNIIQKMDLYKNGSDLWFAYYGIYTNFGQANIQPLILLSFLFFKFFLLKLIVYPFPMLRRKANMKWSSFFQIFSSQLSCFTPFLIISSATTLKNVSEQCLNGMLNSVTQIFIIFVIIFIPLLNFLIKKTKTQNMKATLRKGHNKIILSGVKKEKRESILEAGEAFTLSFMSFYIPFFILVQSPLIFFVFTTPLILKRIITTFSHRKVFSCYKNLIRFFTTLAWATYHFSFLVLYIIQLILEANQTISQETADDTITLLGYAIVCSILMGGLFDILNSIIQFTYPIFILLKKAWTLLRKNVIIPQVKIKNIQENLNEHLDQRQRKCKKMHVGVLNMRLQQQMEKKKEQQHKTKNNRGLYKVSSKVKQYFEQIRKRNERKAARKLKEQNMMQRQN